MKRKLIIGLTTMLVLTSGIVVQAKQHTHKVIGIYNPYGYMETLTDGYESQLWDITDDRFTEPTLVLVSINDNGTKEIEDDVPTIIRAISSADIKE